jgi:hypothetical protein
MHLARDQVIASAPAREVKHMKRPVGVTILAILAIIGGAFALLGSLLLFLAGAAIASGSVTTGSTNLSAGTAFTVAVVALVLGALDIVWGIGALRLRPWAWTLGIALGVLNVLSSILNIVLGRGLQVSDYVGIIIAILIIVYLFTPRVRQAFGRA